MTRHKRKHKDQLAESRTEQKVEFQIADCQMALNSDACYPEALRKAIFEHEYVVNETFYCEVYKIYRELVENGDIENFYSTFYSNFVVNASDCLNMENPMATLVTKRLADKLLYHAKDPTELPQEQPALISCRELSGLQYLAGYVVHKFMKKAKYNTKYEIVLMISFFLLVMRA